MNEYARTMNASWLSLFILLGLTLVFSIAVQFAVISIGSLSIYILLVAGTLGAFLFPSLGLQHLEKYFVYFPQQRQSKAIYLVAGLFLFVCGPLMQLLAKWNADLSLPSSLQALERWMKAQEESMALLTEQVVMVDDLSFLFLNLVVMAVLPAIAEEFYFRGSLMHIVQRMVQNNHLTVWITAIVFSAIHLQFYGFFPRLMLGVFFGYMLVWTQNIWIPVLGHFINNASVTIMAYYYARQGKTYQDLQHYETYPIIVYIGSFILTGLLGYWLWRKTGLRYRHMKTL